MTCEECQGIITDYLDGSLSENEQKLVQRHLLECSSCSGIIRELTLVVGLVQPDANERTLELHIRDTGEPLQPLKHPELPLSAEINKEFGITTPLRVFLCHSSDDKEAVRALYERLREEGLKPWLDDEDLLPGQDWELEIFKALRNADVVIACLSRESVKKRGYVQNEIRIAIEISKKQPEGVIFLIPLKLEECEVPFHLSRFHWVNYFEKNGYEKLRRSLKSCAEQLYVQGGA